MKKCSKCKKKLKLEKFYKDRYKKDGLKSQCKKCINKSEKKYRENNPIKFKQYREKNRDKIIQQKKKYYLNNKTEINKKRKLFNLNNREKIKEYLQTPKARFSSYKSMAKRVDRIFNLTLNQFESFLLQPCYYCGCKGKVGVDRMNSNLGYTLKNCVSCCFICNGMKSNKSLKQFITQCCIIAKKYCSNH